MNEAKRKEKPAQRVPVLLDTTLLRGWSHGGAEQPATSLLTSSVLICWTQLCKMKTGTSADPRWARIVLAHLGYDMNHPDQMHLAEFCAWHLSQVLGNVEMLAIAHTTQIVKKDGSPVEDEHAEAEAASRFTTEFYGGEGQDVEDAVMEELPDSDLAKPQEWFNRLELLSILVREEEVAAAKNNGRNNFKCANEVVRRCFPRRIT